MPLPHRHTLPNGFRILVDPVPSAFSAAVMLLLGQGSAHEGDAEGGMTHFCEHLLFKGTPGRDWQKIARKMNLLGGNFNASTGNESVKLYGTVIARDLPETLDLLAAMFLESTFPASEVERERGVILEEIAQYDDIPEDVCGERLLEAHFGRHPYGRPIIGTPESVASFGAEHLKAYWRAHLDPSLMVLSVAGAADPQAVVEQATRLFSGLPAVPAVAPIAAVTPGHGTMRVERDIEQVNFGLAFRGPARLHPDRFAWTLYENILGGGMGSRLFDEVRERRGLAYSIGSSYTPHQAAGILTIAGSTRPETAATAISVCREEVERFAREGADAAEIEAAKSQIERSHLMALESSGVRCSLNGDRELYGSPHWTPEEVIARIHAVQPEDILRVAREVAGHGEPALCVVGPLADAPGLDGVAG